MIKNYKLRKENFVPMRDLWTRIQTGGDVLSDGPTRLDLVLGLGKDDAPKSSKKYSLRACVDRWPRRLEVEQTFLWSEDAAR
jgi:hypothetical protein